MGFSCEPQVVASMNEINKQKRLRDASQMAAEAEKIKAAKESTLSDGREEHDGFA